MILFGASGHCKVIIDILLLNNYKIDKILDDKPLVQELYNIPVFLNDGKIETQKAIISIGNNVSRKKIATLYNLEYISAFHPKATISKFSNIGFGTVAMANCSINPDVTIGNHCIINTNAIIEHDCEISDFVHICPNAAVAGNVKIGEGSQIGIGACLKQGISIGKWCVIGAGAVILEDVLDNSVVVGNPGRILNLNNGH